MNSNTTLRPIAAAVASINAAYRRYERGFKEITRRARRRFERRDWSGAQADATERLALYKAHVDAAVADVHDILEDAVMERTVWAAMRSEHALHTAGQPDVELAETFFNSVTRRVFSTVGVDPAIEYLDRTPAVQLDEQDAGIYQSHVVDAVDADLVRRLLWDLPWSVPYAQLDRDAVLVAELIAGRIREILGAPGPVTLDLLRAVFYRNKGAYLVGRIRAGTAIIPLVLPLLHAERGIVVDAVLMTSDEASVVFGFSWTYFRVDSPRPRALVDFLGSIMPLKPVNELYISIGYNKHGKTVFYRNLMRHLETTNDRFEIAEGEPGLVMTVFALPSFQTVFKIIRDRFGAPKSTNREGPLYVNA